MKSKKIVIKRRTGSSTDFKYDDDGDIYEVIYKFAKSFRKIGNASSLEDAIAICKATVGSDAETVDVEAW